VPADLDQLDARRDAVRLPGQGEPPGRAQVAQVAEFAGLGGRRS
jgi:hypothetical protein